MKLKFIIALSLTLFSGEAFTQLIAYNKLDTAKVYTSLEEALVNPREVYRLDLNKQKIKTFPEEIFFLSNLNELILDRNKLQELPSRIGELKNLQRMSISKNKLSAFIPAICDLKNLVELDLSDNYIEELPDEIGDLEKVENLVLWGNIIKYYPVTLGKLEHLKRLDLLHNEMNQMEQDRLKNLMPNTFIHFSTPCDCTFYDD